MQHSGLAIGHLVLLAYLACRQASATGGEAPGQVVELWQEGDDDYSILSTSLVHMGPCEPHCTEEQFLTLSPSIPYKVKVEVLQVDMQSSTEFVEVAIGGVAMACDPAPLSDYACSFWACGERSIAPLNGESLHVVTTSHQTRDACKCISSGGNVGNSIAGKSAVADWDCYSAKMSDFEETVGMLVRITFQPDVDVEWVAGEWSKCDQWQCGEVSDAMSNRSVTCQARAGDLNLPTPHRRWCGDSEPVSERLCSSTPECAPPPLCDRCFSLQHLVQGEEASWSLVNAPPPLNSQSGLLGLTPEELNGLGGSTVGLGPTARLGFRLKPAVSYPGWHVVPCVGDLYVVWRAPPDWRPLVLDALQSQEDIFRSIFHLKRIATNGYAISDMTGGRAVAAVGPSLVMNRMNDESLANEPQLREASAFMATRVEGPQEPCEPSDVPNHWPRSACRFDSGWCCTGPERDGVIAGCDLSGNRSLGATCLQQGDRWCGQASQALIHAQRCEEIGCRPVASKAGCELAAKTFGFDRTGEIEARLVLASSLPSFCVWQQITEHTGMLWFNARPSEATASEELQQLCACSPPETQSFAWVVGEWGPCGLDCGAQFRYRSVTCVMTVSVTGVPAVHNQEVVSADRCREADLPEPTQQEPCGQRICFSSQQETRCHGPPRVMDESNLQGLPPGVLLVEPNTTSLAHLHTTELADMQKRGSHCVALERNSTDEAIEICRNLCLAVTNCAGFTFLQMRLHSQSSTASSRCCFLQQATSWERNLRHAQCHLLQGLRTRSGCHCQVGWSAFSLAGDVTFTCGAEHGGCCASASSGLPPRCPTTTPDCDAEDSGKDYCDPQGVTAVTEGTCEGHVLESGGTCIQSFSSAQCNQLAMALRLPVTTPTLTHSQAIPPGCIWDTSTSRLILNVLSPPWELPEASELSARLCICPLELYKWSSGEWGACFSEAFGACPDRIRTRNVWCVRTNVLGISSEGAVVEDSYCDADARPTDVAICHNCTREVVEAHAVMQVPDQLAVPPTESDFTQMLSQNFAAALGLREGDLIVNTTRCCSTSPTEALVYIRGSPTVSPGDALGHLMQLTISGYPSWGVNFIPWAATLSITLLGVYSWEADASWSDCSSICGSSSHRSRDVRCMFNNFEDPPSTVADERCDSTTRPPSDQMCEMPECRACAAADFGKHYDVDHGASALSNYPHGSVSLVSCAAGYDTIDDVKTAVASCEHGSWVKNGLDCGQSCDEPDFDASKYEVKGTRLEHGALRHLRCRAPAENALDSASSATSLCNDGVWTQPKLVCAGDCEAINLLEGFIVSLEGALSDSSSVLFAVNGTTGSVTCAPGFHTRDAAAAAESRVQCIDGHWSGLERLPDCHRDCLPYHLPEGYRITATDEQIDGTAGHVGQDNISSQVLSSSQPHGTRLLLQCEEPEVISARYVPEAAQSIRCSDGHWSPLTLVCTRGCPAINTSSSVFGSYSFTQGRLDGYMLQSTTLSVSKDGFGDGFEHGTAIDIGCRGEEGPKSNAVGTPHLRSKIWCENGRWSAPELACPQPCPAFQSGLEYVILHSSRSEVRYHGSRIFVACSEGRSPLPIATSVEEASVESLPQPLGQAVCQDGVWTSLRLRCAPNCPALQLGSDYRSSGNGSLWIGTRQTVSCADTAASADVLHLRCSERSRWMLLQNSSSSPALRAGGTDGFDTEVVLDLQEPFPLDCSLPSVAFWDKLSEDEKAMVACLILLLVLSLVICVGSIVWWRQANAHLRPARPLPRIASWPSLAFLRHHALCRNCQQGEATKACFPCGDLCLCTTCAILFLDGVAQHCPTCSCKVELVVDGEPASIYGRSVFDVPIPVTLRSGAEVQKHRSGRQNTSATPIQWLRRRLVRNVEPSPPLDLPGPT
eukprot:CAMPEP_0178453504 /NCGR_PEP_ID=MMETSP0689_2-20121128/44847_1 /TAXON_ID=160604 /ORGANISM="Amphidinium massartii, Strain CS-259" /LENGTH=1886 /DNA_ID=CAMNT_0020079349 /DNA_START=66 /DNA_END=5722 /DNA_ORIENTATION=-